MVSASGYLIGGREANTMPLPPNGRARTGISTTSQPTEAAQVTIDDL
jgi:hypothetical protein